MRPYEEHPLEAAPDADQRERLEDFLTELTLIARKYNLLLDGYSKDEPMQVVDMRSQTVVGINLLYTVRASTNQVVTYDCEHSILDGVWLVDTSEGPVEQHTLISRPRRKPRLGIFRR